MSRMPNLTTVHETGSHSHGHTHSRVSSRSHGDDSTNSSSSRSRSRTGDDQPHVGKYRLIKTIGKGNFAKVKLAKHIPTGKEVNYHHLSCLVLILSLVCSSLMGC
nr:serine/threonine-protein kinase MARK2-like [Lytechinus pictus]